MLLSPTRLSVLCGGLGVFLLGVGIFSLLF